MKAKGSTGLLALTIVLVCSFVLPLAACSSSGAGSPVTGGEGQSEVMADVKKRAIDLVKAVYRGEGEDGASLFPPLRRDGVAETIRRVADDLSARGISLAGVAGAEATLSAQLFTGAPLIQVRVVYETNKGQCDTVATFELVDGLFYPKAVPACGLEFYYGDWGCLCDR